MTIRSKIIEIKIKKPTFVFIPNLQNKTSIQINKLKFAIFLIFLKLSNNFCLLILISLNDSEDSWILHEHITFSVL